MLKFINGNRCAMKKNKLRQLFLMIGSWSFNLAMLNSLAALVFYWLGFEIKYLIGAALLFAFMFLSAVFTAAYIASGERQ